MKSKNKKAKLISISLLALCFSMLAFGVYALKQATLQVQGTVGFKAHDCMVRVSATIQGDAVVNGTPDADGSPSAERTFFEQQTLGTTSQNQTKTLTAPQDIDEIYFSDLTENGVPHEILITFNISNDSFYPITATISNTMLTNTAVRATIETQSVTLDAKDGQNDEATLTVAYNLDATEVDTDVYDYVDFEDFAYSIGLNFAKVGANSGNQGGNQQQEPQEQPAELSYENLPQTLPELEEYLDDFGTVNVMNYSNMTAEEKEAAHAPEAAVGQVAVEGSTLNGFFVLFETTQDAADYLSENSAMVASSGVNLVGIDEKVLYMAIDANVPYLDVNNLPQSLAAAEAMFNSTSPYTDTFAGGDNQSDGWNPANYPTGAVAAAEASRIHAAFSGYVQSLGFVFFNSEENANAVAEWLEEAMEQGQMPAGMKCYVDGVTVLAFQTEQTNQGGNNNQQQQPVVEPEIDTEILPQSILEAEAIFTNSDYSVHSVDYSNMTAEERVAEHAPATGSGNVSALRDTQGYNYMFFDTAEDQAEFYTQNLAQLMSMYNVYAHDRLTIMAGVDGTKPYVDMTNMPSTMEDIAALFNSNNYAYTNSIEGAAVKDGEGWDSEHAAAGSLAMLNASRVHGMLNKVTQHYYWVIFEDVTSANAYKAEAIEHMPEGYTIYQNGEVLCVFAYEVQQSNNNNNSQSEQSQDYSGEPVITYYEAPNDDKIHTIETTYYSDAELTEVSYIKLETYDIDGETLLTITTSYPVYNKMTGDLEMNKIEIRDPSKEILEAGDIRYDENGVIMNKNYYYYNNGDIVASYDYHYEPSFNYYDEANQQEVNNYAGYIVTARIVESNATRVVNYLTQDATALVTDSAKIDCVRDQYLEYETITYTDVEIDGKNVSQRASRTLLVTDINNTFRHKESTSYTYVVDNKQAYVKTETMRTYDSSDNVLDKRVHTYTTHQGDYNNREFTDNNYIGEDTLRCTQVFTTEGQANSETWYKNGVVSRTITRVKNGDQTESYTERYYQGENLQYRLEVTYENKVEVKTWYNAQNEVIADPELDVENDY